MSVESEKPKKDTRGIWVNPENFDNLKKKLKASGLNVSDEFDRFIANRTAELDGKPSDGSVEVKKTLEELNHQYISKSAERARIEKLLHDSGSYERFMAVGRQISAEENPEKLEALKDVSLDSFLRAGPETERFKETMTKIMDAGDKLGDSQGATLFVRLMQLIKQQKTINGQIRCSAGFEAVANPGMVSEQDSELRRRLRALGFSGKEFYLKSKSYKETLDFVEHQEEACRLIAEFNAQQRERLMGSQSDDFGQRTGDLEAEAEEGEG